MLIIIDVEKVRQLEDKNGPVLRSILEPKD